MRLNSGNLPLGSVRAGAWLLWASGTLSGVAVNEGGVVLTLIEGWLRDGRAGRMAITGLGPTRTGVALFCSLTLNQTP